MNLEDHDMDVILTENPFLKPGVKLPNTTTEWSTANAYFQTRFSANNPDDGNLDDRVAEMNEVIYNYFKENYSIAKGLDDHIKYLENKYSGLTKNQLKKAFKISKRVKQRGS